MSECSVDSHCQACLGNVQIAREACLGNVQIARERAERAERENDDLRQENDGLKTSSRAVIERLQILEPTVAGYEAATVARGRELARLRGLVHAELCHAGECRCGR